PLPSPTTAAYLPGSDVELGAGRARAEALIEEAQAAERLGMRDQARALYERAMRALHGTGDHTLVAALLRWIGVTYQLDADAEAAVDCFHAALATAEATSDEAGIGHAVNALATTHFHQGALDLAESLFRTARESARRSGDAKLSAMTSQNLGIIANIRGELEEALWHYEASLADYRALGLPKYVCMTLNNLGLLYTRMERWETAERALDEAVRLSQMLGDLTTRILLDVNRAAMWTARRDFARAREACDLAVELSRQTRDTRALGEAHKQYGIIARETGDLESAEQSFLRASRLADERQDLLLAAETAREMAELYHRMGRNRDTLHCLNRAHRLFTQLHARPALADVDRQMGRLESDFEEVVRRWSESIESQDRYTSGHCARVADLACAVAREAGMDAKSLFWFRLGALLHDVGKLSIPASVLNKPGRLTAEEWALVRQHPVVGVRMLADVDFPYDVRPIVESHHERWDGDGYPHGLAGEAIPFEARILCIADVYDALTSERSYKKAVPHAHAMEMMRAEAGAQFDPALFEKFESVMRASPELWAGRQPDRAAPANAAAPPVDPTADVDHLTGALLRRAFTAAAENVLGRLRPAEQPPSLLVIDIDHFKLVNDTYGHLTGDDVLCMVLRVLRRTLRTADVVGRYGGDELVVLLPRTPLEHAREVAERLRVAVEHERCPARDRPDVLVGVTLSIGAATALAGDRPEALFAAADRALYEAKRGGRNSVSVATISDAAAPPQLLLSRFVGRSQELRRLVTLLEAAAQGQPRIVAAVGEAGVGKSTLLRNLYPEVRLRGGTMLIGRCAEADVKAPYAPWLEILAAIAAQPGAPEACAYRELRRLVPALAACEGQPDAPRVTGSKYALLDEISAYLRETAARHPLVLVLDDMQWADAASWDTLEHLVTELRNEPILIALTIRAEDTSAEVQSRRRRISRDERFHELPLGRLSREDVEQWLAAASNGADLGLELLPTLYRHTEGNPFLVVQVLRSLVEEGELRFEEGRWRWYETPALRLPVAVSDLMARRLDRLSPKTRSILTTA
ncbi:MAG TPA: diguanylate cyclase, partial [Gemmatimonadaceae bacterium]|nr:diguanylate cyclase [Gemmatimonadaceae bacterium]